MRQPFLLTERLTQLRPEINGQTLIATTRRTSVQRTKNTDNQTDKNQCKRRRIPNRALPHRNRNLLRRGIPVPKFARRRTGIAALDQSELASLEHATTVAMTTVLSQNMVFRSRRSARQKRTESLHAQSDVPKPI